MMLMYVFGIRYLNDHAAAYRLIRERVYNSTKTCWFLSANKTRP